MRGKRRNRPTENFRVNARRSKLSTYRKTAQIKPKNFEPAASGIRQNKPQKQVSNKQQQLKTSNTQASKDPRKNLKAGFNKETRGRSSFKVKSNLKFVLPTQTKSSPPLAPGAGAVTSGLRHAGKIEPGHHLREKEEKELHQKKRRSI